MQLVYDESRGKMECVGGVTETDPPAILFCRSGERTGLAHPVAGASGRKHVSRCLVLSEGGACVHLTSKER